MIELSYASLSLLVASKHAAKSGYPVVTFEMLHEYFREQVRASAAAPVQVGGAGIGIRNCSRGVLASVRRFFSRMSFTDLSCRSSRT